MSTRKVVYLPEAIDDLHGIWAYVAEQSKSLEVADRLVDAIDDAALLYATSPHTGVPRLDLAPNLRCFTVGQYVIFYLPTREGIEVVQIIHGSRDVPIHFRRPLQ